jgi:serine/threonine protein kinase
MTELPQRIGKYEIKALIGEGGAGIVYEGFDPDIERKVAVKILHPHLISGQVGLEMLARFKREAISAAKCIHPNIVTILEYGQHHDKPFIVMEFVDGISLQKLIKHRRNISLKRTFSIISQLLRALNSAHRLKVVHRDVKASNVLIVRGTGRVKLADFGMARITERPDLTMIGQFIGTPRYMAPELRLGFDADFRADVFSATRLLLELLKLMPPNPLIPCSNLPEIVGMPPGNRVKTAAVYPNALIPVLMKGLEVDRKSRYQTARDLVQAIKNALPLLMQETAIPRRKAIPSTTEPLDDPPASVDELDSLTNLLADFMGPIARIIMEEHETKSTSANNLATEISKEIPESDQQQEFLRSWAKLSLSRRALFNRQLPEKSIIKEPKRPIPGSLLKKIGDDFAHYIGPIAEPLLRHYSSKAKDTDQLVRFLGREIPDLKDGQKFVKTWRHS